jgi:hypothetical protein
VPPPNDLCTNAISLPVNGEEELVGSTVNCGSGGRPGLANLSPGVWYTATGTGGIMRVSTCSESTN